jgi:hypothetical protein
MKPSKYCNHCGQEFFKKTGTSTMNWEQARFCSRSCGAQASGFKKGHTPANWKGDTAGYAAIHIWMRNHYGTPQECEHCGTKEDRRYHWANVSGTYQRDRTDWLRLCVPCHKKYDIGKLGGKIKPKALKVQPTKTCPQCHIVFTKHPKLTQTQWLERTYCGLVCSAAAQTGIRRTTDNPEKQCIACGKTFYKQRYNSQKTWAARQYCDRKCGSEATAKARTGVKESEAIRKIRSAGQLKRHAKRRSILNP